MILFLLHMFHLQLNAEDMAEDSKVLGHDGATGWKESLNDCMAQSPLPLPTHRNVTIPYKSLKNTYITYWKNGQLKEDIQMTNNQIKRHKNTF